MRDKHDHRLRFLRDSYWDIGQLLWYAMMWSVYNTGPEAVHVLCIRFHGNYISTYPYITHTPTCVIVLVTYSLPPSLSLHTHSRPWPQRRTPLTPSSLTPSSMLARLSLSQPSISQLSPLSLSTLCLETWHQSARSGE